MKESRQKTKEHNHVCIRHSPKSGLSSLRYDLAFVLLFSFIGTAVTILLDIYERFHMLTRSLEMYNIDEIVLFFPFFLAIGMVWYSHRRTREKNRELSFRKQTEAALKQNYDELQEAHAQLIQSAKLASIGELASGVAHELNQPLMVIRGTAQLIRRNVRKNNLNNDELMEQLDPIERNTKRMMNIINHLRTFSRQSKGEFSRLDMNKIVKGSFTLINEQLRLHNIEVIEEYASDLPPIQGDATRIEQVIINLIANARDAMDKRETESRVDDKIKNILRISTSKSRDNSHLEVRITDSGEGIPPGDRDRVFDPFFTTKEVGRGTGLGLSISYGIIKDHGGEIEVVETGPEGTTFRIRLPIHD